MSDTSSVRILADQIQILAEVNMPVLIAGGKRHIKSAAFDMVLDPRCFPQLQPGVPVVVAVSVVQYLPPEPEASALIMPQGLVQ